MFSFKSRWPGKPYRQTVLGILEDAKPATILDCAVGNGWLGASLSYQALMDGLDLFQPPPSSGYRHFLQTDLNNGVPASLGQYDAIVCCEAIAYLLNPGQFLDSARKHLKPGGILILSTPNPTYLGARLLYLYKGFSPSFMPGEDNKSMVHHMPWHPLSWYQLWMLCGLAGLSDIRIHDVREPKPKHVFEWLLYPFAYAFARYRMKKTSNPSARSFWAQEASHQVLLGRRLVVTARHAELG